MFLPFTCCQLLSLFPRILYDRFSFSFCLLRRYCTSFTQRWQNIPDYLNCYFNIHVGILDLITTICFFVPTRTRAHTRPPPPHTHTPTYKLFVYPHTQALRHVDCPEQMPSSSWNVTMGTNPGKDDVSRTSAHPTSTCWTPKQLDRKTLREYSIGLNISYDSLHESPLVLEMGKQKRCLY